MAMLQPHVLFVLFAALALAGYGGTRLSARHGTLLRLRATLGDVPPGAPEQPGVVRALQELGARVPGASDSGLKAVLMSAGYFHPMALPVFVALRLLCTAVVFLGVLFWHGLAVQAQSIFLAMFLAFFCSRLFVIALKLKADARQREMRRELPPVVDVLLMVLNSGVSIDQCLRYVAGLDLTGPLVSVIFKRTIADVDGGMPYEAAFERMGQRMGIDEGYDLANLISQALLQGGEIMASLERFSADVAEKRVAASREQIGRKSIYLTIVMLAFFMPVLLITLAGPAVSNIFDTLKVVKQQMHHRGTK